MRIRRPSAATVLAGIALFVALGGPAEAAKTLGLKNNSVTSAKIKNGTLSVRDMSKATIRTLQTTPNGSVRGLSVVDGSLSGADLAGGSVGGDRLAPGSVAGDRLSANSVGAGQIVDGAVGGNEIAPSAVDSDEVEDGVLRGDDIARFAGRLSDLDFATIETGTCKGVTSVSLTPVSTAAAQDLRDDAIVVTPQSGFPAGLMVTAKPASANQIEVRVCNLSGAPVNLGLESFSYIAVDSAGS